MTQPLSQDGTTTSSGSQLDDKIAQLGGDIGADAESASTASKSPDIPGLEFVGCGYNIFGGYADPESVKSPLFDFSAEAVVTQLFSSQSFTTDQLKEAFTTLPSQLFTTYSRPNGVMYKPIWLSDITYQTSGSMDSEQHSLSTKVGLSVDYGAFGGELDLRYDSSTSRLSTTKYCSATAVMRYYELTMDHFPSPALHPDLLPVASLVRSDLDDPAQSPEAIFDAYGTHYLWAVTIGCSIVYGHTIDTTKVDSSFDVGADMKARYEGIGVSANADSTSETGHESSFEKVHIQRKGLDDDGSQADSEGGKAKDGTIGDPKPLDMLRGGWHHPVLIDLPPNALRPVWELCSTKERRDELQAGFAAYAKKHGVASSSVRRDLRPLYLMRRGGNAIGYRLWQSARADSITTPGQWAPAEDGAPWLYVFTEQEDRTVPLYEYYCDHPDNGNYRYETDSYGQWLAAFNTRWQKTSSTPVGYVYDGLLPAPPETATPVFAYWPKNPGDNFRCFYSPDASESRDNAGWRPMRLPHDDLPPGEMPAPNQPPVIAAVLKHDAAAGAGPVAHWLTPSLGTPEQT